MKYQKVTFTFPEHVVEQLRATVQRGKRSDFVADATQQAIVNDHLQENTHSSVRTLQRKHKVKHTPTPRILQAIQQDRK